jgi:phenylpropionate dioxygenase-like ring-hydroxylating dioxygenase large terminal subunit
MRLGDARTMHAQRRLVLARVVLVDNILDLSHADYLHPATLGSGSITRTRAQVEDRGDSVFVRWISPNAAPLPISGCNL